MGAMVAVSLARKLGIRDKFRSTDIRLVAGYILNPMVVVGIGSIIHVPVAITPVVMWYRQLRPFVCNPQ